MLPSSLLKRALGATRLGHAVQSIRRLGLKTFWILGRPTFPYQSWMVRASGAEERTPTQLVLADLFPQIGDSILRADKDWSRLLLSRLAEFYPEVRNTLQLAPHWVDENLIALIGTLEQATPDLIEYACLILQMLHYRQSPVQDKNAMTYLLADPARCRIVVNHRGNLVTSTPIGKNTLREIVYGQEEMHRLKDRLVPVVPESLLLNQTGQVVVSPAITARVTILDALPLALPLRLIEFFREPERSKPLILNSLTKAEREVVALILKGHTNESIARQRSTSYNTVKKIAAKSYQKLGVSSRHELAARVIMEKNLFPL